MNCIECFDRHLILAISDMIVKQHYGCTIISSREGFVVNYLERLLELIELKCRKRAVN